MRKDRVVEISGGRAGFNFVSFTGEKYQAISRFKKGKIITETKLIKGDNKITMILSQIPFVRSFSMIFELIIENWKRFLFTTIALFLMEFLLVGKSNSYHLLTIPINTLVSLAGFLVIAGLFIKISPIGRFHGAEHMTANAFDSGLNLTLENVKMQPRTHNDCGTNLVISCFICFFILFMIFGESVWLLLASWSIGYELWRNEPKIIWDLVLIIGKGAQYLLFTSKPKEKHLIVAMEAFKKLEERELANME